MLETTGLIGSLHSYQWDWVSKIDLIFLYESASKPARSILIPGDTKNLSIEHATFVLSKVMIGLDWRPCDGEVRGRA